MSILSSASGGAAARPSLRAALPWLLLLVTAFACSLAPPYVKDTLIRPCAWGIVVLTAFGGFGSLVAKLTGHPQLDFGLRSVVGASAMVLLGGVLALLSIAKAPVLFALVLVGVALQGLEIARSAGPRALSPTIAWRLLRRFPARFVALGVVLVFLALTYLGAAADTSSNPYDDDVAYYPFVKQLLQVGTILDPFSFRRMSTLGGQTFFHALLGTRLDVLNANVFDRGICVVMVVWQIAGRTRTSAGDRKGDRAPWFMVAVAALFFLLLRYTGINSASYYSGVAFFFGLYQAADLVKSGAPKTFLQSVLPLVLIGAAACTLRQNYLVPVVIFQALVVLRAFGLGAPQRRNLLVALFVSFSALGLFVLPWSLLLFRSNDTLLWPLMRGTFTQGAATTGGTMTISLQVQHFVGVFFMQDPIKPLPLFFLGALFFSGPRARTGSATHTTSALSWIAGLLGMLALSVSFSLSDAGNLARYHYGFMAASVLFTWRSLGIALNSSGIRALAARNQLALLTYAICIVGQLVNLDDRSPKPHDLHVKLRDIDEKWHRSIPSEGSAAVTRTYAALQAHVPAGQRILALVDEPFGFDFARNPILNLDLPGLSGKAPGFCAFRGADALADYFQKTGQRYLALVLPKNSIYLFRKEIWFEHVYDPDELWRVYAPYILDAITNLEIIANTHKVLYQGDGMVLVDLAERVTPAP